MQGKSPTNRRLTYSLVAGCLVVVAALALIRPALLGYRLWRARAALVRRDADTVLVWLDAAARLKPKSSEIAFLRARAYRRLAQPEQVRRQLLLAAELGYPVELIQREDVLMSAQQGRLSPGSPEVAALTAETMDDTREVYEALVRGYLGSYHLVPAWMLLDGWEADYPDDPLPHYFRGLTWANREAWQEAANAFREALRLGSDRPDTRRRLADALREDYRYREALWHYDRSRDQEQTAEVLYGRGKCLEALSDTDGAREAYVCLLELAPNHFDGRLALGQLEYSQGEYQAAAEDLQLAVRQYPNDFNARHALAWALLILGEKEQARKHFELAVKVRYAMHRTANLQARVEKQPANTNLRYELGVTLMENNRQSDGVVWLQSVIQLQPDHRLAHLALADYYTKRADAEVANHHRRAATSQ